MNYLVASDRMFREHPGGAQRIAWTLACAMRERGHTVACLCGTLTEGGAPEEVIDSIHVVRYPIAVRPSWSPLRWRASIRAASRSYRRYLSSVPWDVIHGHGIVSTTGILNAEGSGGALIYTAHSPVVLEQQLNWANNGIAGAIKRMLGVGALRRTEAAILRRARIVHVLSRYTRTELRHCHGEWVERNSIEVPWWATAPESNVSREDARSALGIPHDCVVFLSVRRLVRRMGLDVLVSALSRLRDEASHLLVIAGAGPERDALERQAKALGVAGTVRFLGQVNDAQLEQAYTACDAFVLPTRALECFGIIAVEALAHGRPVIGTSVGAIPEVIGPVCSEWLVAPEDPRALAEAMRAFLRTPPPRIDESRLQAYAAARFGRTLLLPRYESLLEQAAGGTSATAGSWEEGFRNARGTE